MTDAPIATGREKINQTCSLISNHVIIRKMNSAIIEIFAPKDL
jgi:hypothetical protein